MTFAEQEIIDAALSFSTCDKDNICDACKLTKQIKDYDWLTGLFLLATLDPLTIPHLCAKFLCIGYTIAEMRMLEDMVK